MALTPEDVVNKRFQPTKFREGYDQDEVDDFLDEVVSELRRLTGENDDLRGKLATCEKRVGELARGDVARDPSRPSLDKAGTGDTPSVTAATAAATSAGTSAVTSGVTTVGSTADGAPSTPRSGAAGGGSAPSGAPPGGPRGSSTEASPAAGAQAPAGGAVVTAPAADAGVTKGAEMAAGMLALAQRLHDEHVRNGEEQRDKIVTDAREHATRVVRDAEEKQKQTLGSLEQERSMLERKIDELRNFERQYRSRLKSYLESQLRDLDARADVVPGRAGAGADSGADIAKP